MKLLPLLLILFTCRAHAQAPALNIAISRSPLLQGTPFALFVSDPDLAGHPAITVTATLDGAAVALQQPEPDLWAYGNKGYGAIGPHTFAISIAEGGAAVGTQSFQFSVQHNSGNAQIPNVSGVTPNVVDVKGGTTILVSGTNFTSGAVVKINGVAVSTSFVSGQALLAVTPSFNSVTGPEDVEVVLPLVPGLGGAPNAIAHNAIYASATPPGPSPVPVAIINNASQAVAAGSVVQLDGSGSYDPAGNALSYVWTFLAAPANSSLVIGSSLSDAAKPSFIPDVPGLYVLRLVAQELGVPSPQSSSPELAVVQVSSAGRGQLLGFGALNNASALPF